LETRRWNGTKSAFADWASAWWRKAIPRDPQAHPCLTAAPGEAPVT
jgi:hypothetical protein